MHSHRSRSRARRSLVLSLLLVPVLLATTAADARIRTYGWLEWAFLKPDHVRIKAKLDTGAKTSSIHAVDIEKFTRDDREWVRFNVPITPRNGGGKRTRIVPMERPIVRDVLIKAHRGEALERPVVNIDICLGGITFTTPVTLTDRSRFNYPLLLGRVALQGRAVVDVAQKYVNDKRCAGARAQK